MVRLMINAVSKRPCLFLRFSTETDLTGHELEAYVRDKLIDDVKCTKISSKHPHEYSSFKVTVPAPFEDVIANPKT